MANQFSYRFTIDTWPDFLLFVSFFFTAALTSAARVVEGVEAGALRQEVNGDEWICFSGGSLHMLALVLM